MSIDSVVGDQGKTIRELANENGVKLSTVFNRLSRGWTAEDAATKPVRTYTRKAKGAREEYVAAMTGTPTAE